MTNGRFCKALAILNEISPDGDMAEFEDRIIAQKVIYLAQELGIEVGYDDYRWTMRGVYSIQFNKELFEAMASHEQTKVPHGH